MARTQCKTCGLGVEHTIDGECLSCYHDAHREMKLFHTELSGELKSFMVDIKRLLLEDKKRMYELEHLLQSYRDFMRNPTIAGDEYNAISFYAEKLHRKADRLLGMDE